MPTDTPAPTDFRIVFPNTQMAVRRALAALKQGLRHLALSEDDSGTVEVVLGEVLNNIVEHAYGPDETGEIEIACVAKGAALYFRVSDRGQALPGLSLPEGRPASLDCAREDLPEGGFGWFLVRELARELSYSHEVGCNRLHFQIPLHGRLSN